MPSATPPSPPAAEHTSIEGEEGARFRAVQAAELAVRAGVVAVLGLGGVVFGLVLDTLVIPRALGPRLPPYVLLGGTSALVLGALRSSWGRAGALWLALAIVVATAGSLYQLCGLLPEEQDVFVGVFAASMVITALVFPWGPWAQLAATGTLAAAYLAMPGWSRYSPDRTLMIAVTLGDGVALSLAGAYFVRRVSWSLFLERERVARARDQAVREREEAERAARERALLLRATGEIAGTTDVSVLAARIVRLGRELVACDKVGLTLVMPGRRRLRVAAIDSDDPLDAQSLGAEFENGSMIPSDELAERGLVEVPGGTDWDRFHAFFANIGMPRTLFAGLCEPSGAILGYLTFVRVTDERHFTAAERGLAEGLRQQAATALASARLLEALERANRVKAEFVSTMSHELRTPLHVIMGYTEILDDADAHARKIALDRIRHASRDLLELVESTLDLSRLEAGQDEPRMDTVALQGLWYELQAEFAVVPRREAVALWWEPSPELALVTDRRKLKIIVKNLVGNALKYTEEGRVVASCRATAVGCEIVVRDTGIGIAADHLEHVFEMFRQVDGSDSRSFGGVGLGLYIVKRLADQLGGTVVVESTPGVGSTFTLSLPVAAAVASRAA